MISLIKNYKFFDKQANVANMTSSGIIQNVRLEL